MEIITGTQTFVRLVLLPAVLLATISGCQGLKVKKVVVPPHEKMGKGVVLKCEYDLEGDQLYSVKWYKGIKEFFRYVPADNPPIQVFDLPGVHVDRDKSNDRKVTLKEVSLKTSGKYKCEVSAEAPSFHTDSGAGELLVVHMPEHDPHISGMRTKYHVGDLVQVNCTSSPSKPAAALMWYINDKQADSGFLVDYAPVSNGGGLETSILGLHFRARMTHLRHGHLKLRCSATIAAVYYREKTIFARGFLTHNGDVLESRGIFSGSDGRGLTGLWVLAPLVGVLLLR
ncbi:cell adhesion molecule 1-like isoform X2 [Penaeus vannamei]|uniref:cell adhesion molecule 1-like isoform X2 n=1 Tax=Penaeus vannamei TaxID=6689 RepID=UPI00387F8659